jgi:hypothetical protein
MATEEGDGRSHMGNLENKESSLAGAKCTE